MTNVVHLCLRTKCPIKESWTAIINICSFFMRKSIHSISITAGLDLTMLLPENHHFVKHLIHGTFLGVPVQIQGDF